MLPSLLLPHRLRGNPFQPLFPFLPSFRFLTLVSLYHSIIPLPSFRSPLIHAKLTPSLGLHIQRQWSCHTVIIHAAQRVVKLHALQRLFWVTGIYLLVQFRLDFHPFFEWAFFVISDFLIFLKLNARSSGYMLLGSCSYRPVFRVPTHQLQGLGFALVCLDTSKNRSSVSLLLYGCVSDVFLLLAETLDPFSQRSCSPPRSRDAVFDLQMSIFLHWHGHEYPGVRIHDLLIIPQSSRTINLLCCARLG